MRGGGEIKRIEHLIGKGDQTKAIKALFCLCRDCAMAATISLD